MGAIDGFNATWKQARQTYGEGTPATGESFDQSSKLNQLKSDMDAAAPGGRWQGTAADAYGKVNTDHQQVLGRIAELDQKVAAQVNKAADIVSKGRQDLETNRTWVNDAANSTTNDRAGQTMKMVIASKGLQQLTDIMQGTDRDMQPVKNDLKKLQEEYETVSKTQKYSKDGKGDKEDKDADALGDELGEKKDEEQSPAEQGKADSEAMQNGTLTDEQRQRIETNTKLSPEQTTALKNGSTTIPPDQMAYLQNFSREFGDKTPREIQQIMEKNGDTGNRAMDAMQIASNPNITTGVPPTDPPSLEHPAAGGKYALPDGIQKVLDGPVLTDVQYGPPVKNPDGSIGMPEVIGAAQPVDGLNSLADIMQKGDPSLRMGTALDSGMFSQSERLLAESNQSPVPLVDGKNDIPRWQHQIVDPTLQNMFNAVNKDQMVIHDALVGPPQTGDHGEQTFLSPRGERFLDNMTMHQWQDDGLAAGGLFDWVGDTADHDVSDRAAQTAHALAEFTSNHSPELLNLQGADNQSLGQVNPELTRDMARAFAPYMDDMVGKNFGGNNGLFSPLDPDGASNQPTHTRQLMSVLFSDQPPAGQPIDPTAPKTASQIMFDASKGYIDTAFDRTALSVADPNVPDDTTSMRSAAKLQAALDLGSFDEANDRMGDEFNAKHSSWELRSMLFDAASTGAEHLPGAAGPLSEAAGLGKEILLGPEPVRGQPPNLELPDTFPIETHMAEALARAHMGDTSLVGKYMIGDDLTAPPQTGDGRYAQYQQDIKQYMSENDPSGTTRGLVDEYWRLYAGAIVSSYPRPPQ